MNISNPNKIKHTKRKSKVSCKQLKRETFVSWSESNNIVVFCRSKRTLCACFRGRGETARWSENFEVGGGEGREGKEREGDGKIPVFPTPSRHSVIPLILLRLRYDVICPLLEEYAKSRKERVGL